jgi:hypothetical protein
MGAVVELLVPAISKWRYRHVKGAEECLLCAKTRMGGDQQNGDGPNGQYDICASVSKEDVSCSARTSWWGALFRRDRDRREKMRSEMLHAVFLLDWSEHHAQIGRGTHWHLPRAAKKKTNSPAVNAGRAA